LKKAKKITDLRKFIGAVRGEIDSDSSQSVDNSDKISDYGDDNPHFKWVKS